MKNAINKAGKKDAGRAEPKRESAAPVPEKKSGGKTASGKTVSKKAASKKSGLRGDRSGDRAGGRNGGKRARG